MEFHLFLPQMRLAPAQLIEKAQAAESAGFGGIAGMDHLYPPLAADQPMFEAMVTNTWLAASTEQLKVSSLVLCDSFRHPAVLAREAVTLDHFSGGRFELGIGWGSQAGEIEEFGTGSPEARHRVGRLKESLEVMRALWTGETVDFDGQYLQLRGARQAPLPLDRIPIVIGGAGHKTMELVAAHADWWNVHIGILDKLEEMRPQAGSARVSIQQMVAFVPSEEERAQVTELANRRYGTMGVVAGNAEELVDHFGGLQAQGIERVYAWFTDFARPESLAAFGEGVLAPLR